MLTLNETTPQARKRRQCDTCCGWIEAGQTYHRWSGIYDGEMRTTGTCAHCQLLGDWIWRTDRDAFDPDYGCDISEWVREYGPANLGAMIEGRWQGVTLDELRAVLAALSVQSEQPTKGATP